MNIETYGAIFNDDTLVSDETRNKMQNYKVWLADTQILTGILMYVCYLRDKEGFNFAIRVFTQMILYNVPDTDNLEELRHMISSENLQQQIMRINMMLLLIVPYTILNFTFTVFDHAKWFYNSLGPVDYANLINDITYKTLNTTTYIHEGLFVDLVGETSMTVDVHTPINTLYLVVLDIAIVFLQLLTIQVLRQRLQHRLYRMDIQNQEEDNTIRITAVSFDN